MFFGHKLLPKDTHGVKVFSYLLKMLKKSSKGVGHRHLEGSSCIGDGLVLWPLIQNGILCVWKACTTKCCHEDENGSTHVCSHSSIVTFYQVLKVLKTTFKCDSETSKETLGNCSGHV